MTLEASGVLQYPVTEGATAIVTIKLGLIKIMKKEYDICVELEKRKDTIDIQCPIEPGVLKVSTI